MNVTMILLPCTKANQYLGKWTVLSTF